MFCLTEAGQYLEGARILLIDDSVPFQRMTKAMLEKMGVSEVILASTISEGLEHVYDASSVESDVFSRFDVILMDLNLPDGDGIQGCEFISGRISTSSIPLVVVSGSKEPGVVSKAIEAGACDFLQKPLTADLLKLRLGSLLKMRALESRQETPLFQAM